MTTHVATFVSGSRQAPLSEALLLSLARHLPEARTPQWLDPAVAADIFYNPPAEATELAAALRNSLATALADAPIDFILQPQAGRRKKLFVADMDSTVIGQECIDELADFIGQREHVAAITERAMRGEIAFEPALVERMALFEGLSARLIAKVIAERVTIMPGAHTLVATMRANGAYTALISGGFTLFTREVAAMIGFHTHRANVLVIEDGKLTGRIEEPILGMSAKRDALVELRTTLGLAAHETLAIGDGANDSAMLSEAGLGVAFHAKPTVAAAAHARIDHCDLTALLYAQGYRKADFRN